MTAATMSIDSVVSGNTVSNKATEPKESPCATTVHRRGKSASLSGTSTIANLSSNRASWQVQTRKTDFMKSHQRCQSAGTTARNDLQLV